jgi:hypothetical protein
MMLIVEPGRAPGDAAIRRELRAGEREPLAQNQKTLGSWPGFARMRELKEAVACGYRTVEMAEADAVSSIAFVADSSSLLLGVDVSVVGGEIFGHLVFLAWR